MTPHHRLLTLALGCALALSGADAQSRTPATPAPEAMRLPFVLAQVPAADPAGWTDHAVLGLTLRLPGDFDQITDRSDEASFLAGAPVGFREIQIERGAGIARMTRGDFANWAEEVDPDLHVQQHPDMEIAGIGTVSVMEILELHMYQGERRSSLSIAAIADQGPSQGPGFVIWLTRSGGEEEDVDDERAFLLAVLGTLSVSGN